MRVSCVCLQFLLDLVLALLSQQVLYTRVVVERVASSLVHNEHFGSPIHYSRQLKSIGHATALNLAGWRQGHQLSIDARTLDREHVADAPPNRIGLASERCSGTSKSGRSLGTFIVEVSPPCSHIVFLLESVSLASLTLLDLVVSSLCPRISYEKVVVERVLADFVRGKHL